MKAIESLKISRRNFIKASLTVGAGAALGRYIKSREFNPTELFSHVEAAEDEGGDGEIKFVKTICIHCAVGCGILAKVKNNLLIGVEPWIEHPINAGSVCSKGAATAEIVTSERRLKYPMKKEAGRWVKIKWDDALDEIAEKLKEIREKYGPDSVMFLGSAKVTNEEAYLFRKFAAFWGTNNVDHQARICHSTTVAGLANTWGYGAMTNNFNDMRHSKCIMFFGSNACEAHPVAMQHILEAKDRGAKIIVCDPRFTRTASKADIYVRFRPGSDVALLLGIAHEIIKNGWHDKEFIEKRTYGFEEFKKIAEQYPPEEVEKISWVPAEKIREIAETLAKNKPATIVWAMGATQHSVGTQIIRMFAILELLLGCAGKSGGGCNALRGHDNVQGATDMCILSHSLPAYYGLSEKAWKHWCNVWNVSYEWIKSRFFDPTGKYKPEELMQKKGFTVARWYEGVLREDIDQPNPIKAVFVWGHSLNSISRMKRLKEALEKVELLVCVDPHATIASSLPERDSGIYLLPASTVWEKDGSVTNSARQVQWRNKVIEPLYDSRPDLEILIDLAEKLGFKEEFTRNFKEWYTGRNGKRYPKPEEVLREINRGARSIGMIGQTPERLKKQQEYAHTFNRETLRAEEGPCKGEYWGLPWPCWNDWHPGTPILYDNSKPVSEGGHDFRVKWGTKAPDGESLLSGINGHDQVKIGDVLWLNALDADYKDIINKNMLPSGRGRARFKAWNLPDPIPIHREPIHSPYPDLVKKYPTYDDVPKFYRVDTPFKSAQEECLKSRIYEKYPLLLTSGRQVEHQGGGAETRSCPYLVELQPEVYAEIHPKTAMKYGIGHGDMVWVESPFGRIKVKARITKRVNEKEVFIPFHWAGIFEGESYVDRYPRGTAEIAVGDSVNIILCPGYDRVTQMQETKVGLCKIYRAWE